MEMESTAAAAEQRRRVLEAVFGDSSDGEVDAYPVPLSLSLGDRSPRWYPVHGVDGLWLCPDFLSAPQQASLLSAIQREGWFVGGSHNQAMRFGDLPDWATELTEFICEVACFGEVISLEGRELIGEDRSRKETCPLPLDLLWREPFFDQLIVNSYEPGEGICAHVDLMRFEDGIAIVSLESSCVMHFTRAKLEANNAHQAQEVDHFSARIPVFLTPGSLVLMSGEARYHWMHEINRKPGFQMWDGKELEQQRRISITLRKLCGSPK